MEIFENIEAVSSRDISSALRSAACRCGMARYTVCGLSLCSREIAALEIGSMYRPALFVGGTHGTEWASVLCCLKLALELAEGARARRCEYGIDIGEALRRSGAVFIPLLNPDGYEIFKNGEAGAGKRAAALARYEYGDFRHWQANARGVDINHNFNAGFYKARRMTAASGVTKRGPTRYGGAFPFSEPESRAARRVCARCRPRSLFSLHSQGEEIYWRYGERTHRRAKDIGETLAALSGYALADPEPPASHAGLKDWFVQKYGLPAFTIELGRGANPLPYGDFEDIWRQARHMLYVAAVI